MWADGNSKSESFTQFSTGFLGNHCRLSVLRSQYLFTICKPSTDEPMFIQVTAVPLVDFTIFQQK